jgi:hypothetical protein
VLHTAGGIKDRLVLESPLPIQFGEIDLESIGVSPPHPMPVTEAHSCDHVVLNPLKRNGVQNFERDLLQLLSFILTANTVESGYFYEILETKRWVGFKERWLPLFLWCPLRGLRGHGDGSRRLRHEITNDRGLFLHHLCIGGILPAGLGQGIGSALKQAFKNFKLLSVDAFALVNLWFPAKHVVSLKEVQIPADLYLTGSLVQPIEVTPVDSVIAPGGQVQFTASGIAASDVLWETKPRSGSISATGLYTAPSFISGAEVVVVIAVNKNDANKSGSAMVLVDKSPAASGVAVAPGNSVVTPGQSIQLWTTDANDQPVNVNWTLSPNIGQIVSGFTDGSYTYTAPASIESATQVTASAVNASKSSLTGVAIIHVTPSAVITVTPAQASAKPSATVVLTATATAGNTNGLCWVVYPTGAGTVKANPNNSAQATYIAPKAGHPDARVVAYLVDDEAAGVGWSDIKLTS